MRGHFHRNGEITYDATTPNAEAKIGFTFSSQGGASSPAAAGCRSACSARSMFARLHAGQHRGTISLGALSRL